MHRTVGEGRGTHLIIFLHDGILYFSPSDAKKNLTKIFAILKPQREFELCNAYSPGPTKLICNHDLKKEKSKLAFESLCWLCSVQCLTVLLRLPCSWWVTG